MNILDTKVYKLSEEEKFPVIKNWFGWEDLQLIQTFTQDEKGKCRTAKDLFTVLWSKFKLPYNRIVILLQYHKLHRKSIWSTQEWMGRLRNKTKECQHKDYDRSLTEQFINGLNDNEMVDGILRGSNCRGHQGHKWVCITKHAQGWSTKGVETQPLIRWKKQKTLM